ncbi:MAG: hypothetical protein ACMXYK_01835 [Candidatus Woesearchaeota archaeon]
MKEYRYAETEPILVRQEGNVLQAYYIKESNTKEETLLMDLFESPYIHRHSLRFPLDEFTIVHEEKSQCYEYIMHILEYLTLEKPVITEYKHIQDIVSASKSESNGIRQHIFRSKTAAPNRRIFSAKPGDVPDDLDETDSRNTLSIYQNQAKVLFTPFFREDAPEHGLHTRVYLRKDDLITFKAKENLR